MSKRNPLLRDIRDAKLISKLNAAELTLMMRKNAEALHLDLAGQSRAFNPARPPKRRRNPR